MIILKNKTKKINFLTKKKRKMSDFKKSPRSSPRSPSRSSPRSPARGSPRRPMSPRGLDDVDAPSKVVLRFSSLSQPSKKINNKIADLDKATQIDYILPEQALKLSDLLTTKSTINEYIDIYDPQTGRKETYKFLELLNYNQETPVKNKTFLPKFDSPLIEDVISYLIAHNGVDPPLPAKPLDKKMSLAEIASFMKDPVKEANLVKILQVVSQKGDYEDEIYAVLLFSDYFGINSLIEYVAAVIASRLITDNENGKEVDAKAQE